MTKRSLKRRTFLRGLLGGAAVTVSLPVLDIMLNENGDALAQDGTGLPKRFGVFYWGNGVQPSHWNPSSTGAGFTLSHALEPLGGVKPYINVVSGMNIMSGNERGHHDGTVGILSGAPMVSQDPMGANFSSTFSQPTIDQVVANHLSAGTPFRSIEYGIHDGVIRSEGSTIEYLSHNGSNDVNPPEYQPRALFNRLFGDGFVRPEETPEVDPRLALRRSVLDAVTADAAALRSRLGRVDQRRLDQHLEGIRALEARLALLDMPTERPPRASCDAPGTPAEHYPGDALVERNQVMSQIIAMALACDQTRVFSNMFSGSLSGTRYPGTHNGHHSLSHDEPGDRPQMASITRYIMERFAELLTALRDVSEGDSNLLERCVILASTDSSDSRTHSITDYPIVIAGRGGGRLRGDFHFRSGGQNASRALLSCLRALDIDAPSFGHAGGRVTEVCGEIMV